MEDIRTILVVYTSIAIIFLLAILWRERLLWRKFSKLSKEDEKYQDFKRKQHNLLMFGFLGVWIWMFAIMFTLLNKLNAGFSQVCPVLVIVCVGILFCICNIKKKNNF